MDVMPPAGSPEDVERELRDRARVAQAEAEPPPPVAPRHAFRRRTAGKVVAGVAGGLADYWALPTWLVRIPFLATAFIAGVMAWNAFGDEGYAGGVLGMSTRIAMLAVVLNAMYVILWWLVPRDDVGISSARRSLDRFGLAPARSFARRYPGVRSWPGLAMLVFGGALLADQLGIWNANVAIAFGLIAVGVALYRREPVGTEPRPSGSVRTAGAATLQEPPGPVAAPVPPVPRERSPLGWVVVGTALLGICVAAMVLQSRDGSADGETLGTWERVSTAPALGLLVLGVGLIVASVIGRARWLIVPALLLLPAMLLASVVRLPLEGRYGDTVVYVQEIADVHDAYRTTVGRVYLDLSKFDRRDDIQRLPISASAVAGTVTIVLPFDATYTATGHTGFGELSFGPNANHASVDVDATTHVESRFPGGPSFVFDLETGIGNVSIYRYAPTKQQLRELEKRDHR